MYTINLVVVYRAESCCGLEVTSIDTIAEAGKNDADINVLSQDRNSIANGSISS